MARQLANQKKLAGARAAASASRRWKYTADVMLAGLRALVAGRNAANAVGLGDNHGAIASVERVLDILRVHLAHTAVSRTDTLKRDPDIEGTKEAFAARARGERVEVEHVYPRREVALNVCALVEREATDQEIGDYIVATSRVVLLTPEQRAAVDAVPGNRSRYAADRLERAGLKTSRRRPPAA
jgi:hypothetical protein